MPSPVAIYQAPERHYSDAWMTADDFPEKRALRELGRLLGHEDGNMFRGAVEPGMRVTVKPNWVLNFHPTGLDVFSVITHSAVLRAVVDLLHEAMSGEGAIVIADAPQFNCDFDKLLEVTQVERIAEYHRRVNGFDVPIRDLRQVVTIADDVFIKAEDRIEQPGDPCGYAVVDFGRQSAFVGLENADRIYGADYDRKETLKHHNDQKHEYLVARTMLDADVVVHVPKLKVHKKVGITVNAKGMVGINGNKNWLAHYRVGPPAQGGDEFPDEETGVGKARARAMRFAIDHLLAPQSRPRELAFNAAHRVYRAAKPTLKAIARRNPSLAPGDDMLHGGNWHGNDTAWRMTVDLARAILFADSEGRVHDTPQRKFLSVVDGIVAGEREGPLSPNPKHCGVLLGGHDLLAVDLACARLMGYDWNRIRYQRWLIEESPHDMGVADPAAVELRTNVAEWADLMTDPTAPDLAFQPHPGWVGKIELAGPASAAAA
jgi:uncharacterized protein (DUF362 family)